MHDACIDYTYLENCSIFVKDGVETRPFWEVDFRMRIVQTLGRKFEICKWFSLLAGLSLPMWTWAGVWIAGQKRPFATSWICLSRQEGVQTKAWPDKKADLQRCLDKTPWNCAHLPANWFAPFVFLYFLQISHKVRIGERGLNFTIFYICFHLFLNRSAFGWAEKFVQSEVYWPTLSGAIKWIGQQGGKSKEQKKTKFQIQPVWDFTTATSKYQFQ